jgi:hypothetical protein
MPIALTVPLLILTCFTASAATIIAPLGPSTNASTVNSAQFQALGFSTLTGFTNVSISASLIFVGADSPVGVAMLTNQIGPGSTIANQIASTTFNFVPAASLQTVANVNLFSGLTLPASTYYLVLSASSPSTLSAIALESAGYQTAPGVTVLTPQFADVSNLNAAFPPASTFSNSSLGNRIFTVTGDPVPEPATATLVVIAAFGLFLLRKQRSGNHD